MAELLRENCRFPASYPGGIKPHLHDASERLSKEDRKQ